MSFINVILYTPQLLFSLPTIVSPLYQHISDGAVVLRVDRESPLFEIIKPGDLIEAINGVDIKSSIGFYETIRSIKAGQYQFSELNANKDPTMHFLSSKYLNKWRKYDSWLGLDKQIISKNGICAAGFRNT